MKSKFLLIGFAFLLLIVTNQSFAQDDDKLVILHTPGGQIVIEFFPEDAPNHVENFIKLSEEGFYDGVIFHRIIPGFMIQGGDPNTKDPDAKNTWGTGGPDDSVNAEFNDIKHNRGIVSMARSVDPNSAGSQFFIVHENSNFLDTQYTVFGRIITQESFETLDKIASLQTEPGDRPVNYEDAKIIRAEVVNRSEVTNLLDLEELERITISIPQTPKVFVGEYTNEELGFSTVFPEDWLVQEPPKTSENVPDVAAIGPQNDETNPQITISVIDAEGLSVDDKIAQLLDSLQPAIEEGQLEVLADEKTTINQMEAYNLTTRGTFPTTTGEINVKFTEIIFPRSDKFYILIYGNGEKNFDSGLEQFEEVLNSFTIFGEEPIQREMEESIATDTAPGGENGGGCLIATATFGTELAPQVQNLREIRDNTLLQTQVGKSFMSSFYQFYYSFSPTIADWERENPIFKETVKISLTPLLTTLLILNNFEINSEAEMLGIGLSIIMLNIGMYFVIPALIINGLRKKIC